MKDDSKAFQERSAQDFKEFRIETLSMLERYVVKAKHSAPDQEHINGYMNTMVDLMVSLVPLSIAKFANPDASVEEQVVLELRNKFKLVREGLTEIQKPKPKSTLVMP